MGERRRQRRCHTPLKEHWRHEGEARHAAHEAAKHYGYAMWWYRCPTCKAWHLTKKAQEDSERVAHPPQTEAVHPVD